VASVCQSDSILVFKWEVVQNTIPKSACHRMLLNACNLVAVIEGGVIYLIRAEQIRRPAFATTLSGTRVWSATPALAGWLGRSGETVHGTVF